MVMNERDLIKLVRRDISNQLVHLTKSTEKLQAINILENIINEERLIGGKGFIKSHDQCICFSETPLSEIANLLKANEVTIQNKQRPRYESYGVIVSKKWAWGQGARPVIYQPDLEYDILPEELKYRHVRYELESDIDFTWEREWRLKAKEIKLISEHTIFVVPTSKEVMYLKREYFSFIQKAVASLGEDALPYIEDFPWRIIPLDIFHE